MVQLYVFGIEIYHFLTSFLQFTQITDLNPIDTKFDSMPHLSWQKQSFFAEVDMAPLVSLI
jgi:hypothetical protein